MSFLAHYLSLLKEIPLSVIFIIGFLFIIWLGIFILRGSLSRKERKRLKRLEKENLLFKKSINLLYKDDRDSAIRSLKRLVELHPDTDEVYAEIARLMREKGELSKAIRMNRSLLLRERLDRDLRIRVLTELGFGYASYGNLENAVKYFHSVIHLDSKNLRVLRALERLYEERGMWDKAYETEKRLSKIEGIKDRRSLINIKIAAARHAISKGDTKSAVKYYKQALSLDKDSVYALIGLGDLFFSQDKKQRALSFWTRAVETDHGFLPLISSKIEKAYFELGKSDELEILYKKCLAEDPKNENLYFLLGRLFLRKNMLEQASREFQRAIEINPLMPDPYASLLQISEDKDYLFSLEEFRDNKNAYKCGVCGFDSKVIFWRCPSCRKWDSKLLF